jgi:hypothetical protein
VCNIIFVLPRCGPATEAGPGRPEDKGAEEDSQGGGAGGGGGGWRPRGKAGAGAARGYRNGLQQAPQGQGGQDGGHSQRWDIECRLRGGGGGNSLSLPLKRVIRVSQN